MNDYIKPGTGRIYYFLQPDIKGDLILYDIINKSPMANNYVIEEQGGRDDEAISLLTRVGGSGKYRKSMKIKWMDIDDRLNNLGLLVVKLLGYDMTTTPTAMEILRNTKLRNKEDFDKFLAMRIDDRIIPLLRDDANISILGNRLRKRKLLKLKPKRKICSCKKKK